MTFAEVAKPICEICEQYRMEDARWILESHIHGLHEDLDALRSRIQALEVEYDIAVSQYPESAYMFSGMDVARRLRKLLKP
jgi:hypothetical protein